MPLDPKFLYNIAPKVTALPVTFGALYTKHGRASPSKTRSLFGASLSTMFIFRGRSNEQHERDVLRPDVISFEVEPLTKRSQGEALLSAAATG